MVEVAALGERCWEGGNSGQHAHMACATTLTARVMPARGCNALVPVNNQAATCSTRRTKVTCLVGVWLYGSA